MSSILYYFNRIKNMSYKGMFDRIDNVNIKTKKPKLLIFLDMVWSGFRYGAGYVDYDVIGFYKLSSKQRKTMLTRGKNDKIVKTLNNKEYWHVFNNKNEFNLTFNDYLKRDWLFLDVNNINFNNNIYETTEYQKYCEFIKNHYVFFAKPNDGECGKGIRKIEEDINNEESCKNTFKEILDERLFLLEEPIKQHEKMNELNPSSVNTIRIVSLMNDNNEVSILATFVRIGNGVNVVDNFNSGGMTAKVDVNTGIIIEDAINKNGEEFSVHPLTNTAIKGFQIPYFEEAKDLIKKVAKLSKNVRYVGWDVAITENGPILVEGNHYPGHDIYQVAEKLDEHSIGVWPEFKKALR